MVRAFLAIDLPQELKKELFKLSKIDTPENIKLKWVEEENLHITLRFFGNISESLVEKIYKRCKEVCKNLTPFELKLSSAGYFPSKGCPRVIWIGIKDTSESIFKLYKLLNKALKPLKLQDKDEDFHPHITLLRIKEKTNQEGIKRLFETLRKASEKLENQKIIVREIVLFKSELSSSGPRYTPLKIIPLGE
jgi:2'-5' RNA ligase